MVFEILLVLLQLACDERVSERTINDMPICEAANYFKEEILQILPGIPVSRLADMVSLYIYFQYGITKEEAKSVVEKKAYSKIKGTSR